MKQKTLKNCIVCLLFLVLMLLFIVFFGRIVTPKRYELGANWGAYSQEQENSMDVLIFGSSLAYCNLIPAVIYEDSGIACYTMAGPEQTAAVTYYYVKEALKTQQPQAILVEASSILYAADTGQDNIKINLCYYPYGLNRIRAALTVAPKEDRLGLLFPLYNYHDRWEELAADDWKLGLSGYEKDLLAGYTFLDDVEVQTAPRQRNFEQTEEEYQNNLSWMQKIEQLCKENDIRCIFFITANYAYFEEGYQQRMKTDLTADGGEFLDSTAELELMDPDPQSDFRDILHFNYRGAEKYSRQMSADLQKLGITPQHTDDEAWQQRIDFYRQKVAESETEHSGQ